MELEKKKQRMDMEREPSASVDRLSVEKSRANKKEGHGLTLAVMGGGLVLMGALSGWFGAILGPGEDVITEDQKIEILQEFSALTARPVEANTLPVSQRVEAVESMGLPPDQARALLAQLTKPDAGGYQILWVEAWDWAVSDGDTVMFTAGPYNITATLTTSVSHFAIPIPPGVHVVEATGIADGHGGITVGATMGGDYVSRLPIFKPGDRAVISIGDR